MATTYVQTAPDSAPDGNVSDNVAKEASCGLDQRPVSLGDNPTVAAEFMNNGMQISGSVPQQGIGDQIADEAQQQVGSDIRVVSRLVVRAATAVESQIARFLKLSNVEFLTNSTDFTRRGLKRLQHIATLLKANMYARFEIAGHTDRRANGTAEGRQRNRRIEFMPLNGTKQ